MSVQDNTGTSLPIQQGKPRPAPLDVGDTGPHGSVAFPSPTSNSDASQTPKTLKITESPLSPTSPDFPSTPTSAVFSFPQIHQDLSPNNRHRRIDDDPTQSYTPEKSFQVLEHKDQIISFPAADRLVFPGKRDYNSILGSGSFCKVIRAQMRDSSHIYAVKVPLSKGNYDTIYNEARVLSKVSGHNSGIIEFHGMIQAVDQYDNVPALVLSQYQGTIETHIDNIKHTLDPYNDQCCPIVGLGIWTRWARQLTSALAFIHSTGYLHCDIKPDNVFVDSLHNVVLGDFASSRPILASSNQSTLPKPEHSILYAAPELLASTVENVQCTCITDSYALGLVLLVAATGNEPYSSAIKNPAQKLLWAQRGLPLQACSEDEMLRISPHIVKLLLKALLIDRESALEVTQHLLTT